jgi:pyruvate dehydrogenase E1 component
LSIDVNDFDDLAQLSDDTQETQEWLEAFNDVLSCSGADRCKELLRRLVEHSRGCGIHADELVNTPYCNTIDHTIQPPYPGDLDVEARIAAVVQWNALAMVVRANRESSELGGHLASYASAADLFEVGFNHFFRGNSMDESGNSHSDLVFFQPHSAPGVYARAFLEGRLSVDELASYRREIQHKGLCSYPHPRLMPDFWQFPTGSMGLGVIAAVYQARFMRYLNHRGLLAVTDRRVWAFIGDGEMDEPESVAGLTLAAREKLDNLTFVINCNLQRLDGPVRGNSSIVQELERLFVGAGWNVIKLLWGSQWDELFARDRTRALLRRFDVMVDGELQNYGANNGSYNREQFFNRDPELEALVSEMSDEQIDELERGGHDPVKIYAAFAAAVRHTGQPTVILAQTKKGHGLGRWAESRMSAHQQKKLDDEALLWCRDRLGLPLSDEDAIAASFYRPPPESGEIRYLFRCRAKLGGSVPARKGHVPKLSAPKYDSFASFTLTPGLREMSTTVAFVKMLTALLKNEELGKLIVPIVADEARTFGMQSLFRQVGIYSHCGQMYEPQDRGDLFHYQEQQNGQILEEGISEAGALASWIAAATSYSTYGLQTLPFYIFYSMFGFQRVGDLIWAAADARSRGFLIGATAGRTTLAGEGLQHQDGTSHLIASTIPGCRAYDPCFSYELATIVAHGMEALLRGRDDVFYYITVMNENYVHPQMPPDAESGILRGMYRFRKTSGSSGCRVQLLGSGSILREVIAAADLLDREWNVSADIWSVTSFTELRRDGLDTDYRRLLQPENQAEISWVERCLGSASGPTVAASDYVRAVPDLIRPWIAGRYTVLGTDGFGRSDTRAALRRFFGVDRIAIAYAALGALASEGSVKKSTLSDFRKQNQFTPAPLPPWAA